MIEFPNPLLKTTLNCTSTAPQHSNAPDVCLSFGVFWPLSIHHHLYLSTGQQHHNNTQTPEQRWQDKGNGQCFRPFSNKVSISLETTVALHWPNFTTGHALLVMQAQRRKHGDDTIDMEGSGVPPLPCQKHIAHAFDVVRQGGTGIEILDRYLVS